MDTSGVLVLVLLLVGGGVVMWLRGQRRAQQRSETWPQTDATVISGAVEQVAFTDRGTTPLPVFSFYYLVDGVYYSGSFSVVPRRLSNEQVLTALSNRVLRLSYDPRTPSIFYLDPTQIAEGDVHQRNELFPVLAPGD